MTDLNFKRYTDKLTAEYEAGEKKVKMTFDDLSDLGGKIEFRRDGKKVAQARRKDGKWMMDIVTDFGEFTFRVPKELIERIKKEAVDRII